MYEKNKFLSFVLVLCITIGLLPTFSANAETLNTTTITLTEPDLNQPPTIEPRGFKTKIAKTALKAFAKSIRSGGKVVRNLADELGGNAGKWVVKHSDSLADVLDDVIAAGDFAETQVRRGIANGLRAIGASSSVADTIANIIVWVFL